jgi:heme exporter protein C
MNNLPESSDNSFFSWWKILTIFLLLYTIIGGFLFTVPRLPILNETIRNLYFHVPMWFSMIIILTISVVFSIMYLVNPKVQYDIFAIESANTGTVLGILGLLTGMAWAKITWGAFWVGDPRLNAAAIGLLVYFAYFILRSSLTDDQQRARISAIYNIFAFPILVALLFVLPRMAKDSLHPGMGGNPGFNAYDINANMRLVFYPAIIAFGLLGFWITTLRVRIKSIEYKLSGIN